jgi:hypothetical protein
VNILNKILFSNIYLHPKIRVDASIEIMLSRLFHTVCVIKIHAERGGSKQKEHAVSSVRSR